MRYTITEVVNYEVEAESAEEAEYIFLSAENPNLYFVSVEEREIQED